MGDKRVWTKRVAILCCVLVGVGLFALVGVANWRYPRGQAHATGEYVEINDGNGVSPKIVRDRSPETNPAWVRAAQDYGGWFLAAAIAVLVIGGVLATPRERKSAPLTQEQRQELVRRLHGPPPDFKR